MNKELYLKRLRLLIRALPNGERETVIDFYREMIDDKIENGETEEQAVAGLGDVNALAQKILMENPNRKPRDTQRVIGIALASFCGVFIVAAIVIFIYSFMTVPTSKTGNVQSATAEAGISEKKTATSPEKGNTQSATVEAGVSEKKTITSPVKGITSIVIEAENKDVVVKQSTEDTVSITYFADKTQTNTATTENGEMKLVNRDNASHDFSDFSDFSTRKDRTAITVSVPKSFSGRMSLNSSNGDITVSDMEQLGDISCETANADITLNRVQAATVQTVTGNADIHLLQVKANRLDANSSNGVVVLSKVTSPELVLITSNADIFGSISGREEDYTIHTKTSDGDCSPESRSGGTKKLTANTSNGDIKIDFTE